MTRISCSRGVLVALGAALLSGCYSYVPTELAAIRPQQNVRVELSDEELVRLRAFADGRAGTVSGDFLGASGDSVSMVVRTPLSYQQVSIPRTSIIQASVRTVDTKKNLIVSAALVGAVGIAAYLGFEGRGGEAGGPGPQPEESVVPFFSFGLPIPFLR